MAERAYNFEAVLPQQGRAAFLRDTFNTSLIESLQYMLEVCEDVIPRELHQEAAQAVNSLDPKIKLSGFLSFINTQLYKAIEEENVELIQLIVSQIKDHTYQTNNIQFVNFTDMNDYFMPRVLHSLTYTLPQERRDVIDVKPLTDDEFNSMESGLREGYNKLKRISPDLYQESQESIAQIMLVHSPGMLGGSSFDMFGMFYCGLDHHWNTTTGVLDFISHEQGHMYLHLLNHIDPLVNNAQEYQISPIRRKERPLMGVYHATFVLSRIIYVLERALEMGEIPAGEQEYCKGQIQKFKEYFDEGMDTINRTAELTPLARGLIDTSQELVAA